jgi:hypothetical protein
MSITFRKSWGIVHGLIFGALFLLAFFGGLHSLTFRESWSAIHGLIFGALFLLAFSGSLHSLYGLRSEWLTAEGLKKKAASLKIWTWTMAIIGWLAVLTGTYIVYPWYRARPPEGTIDLSAFPRYWLLSSSDTAAWHSFGMEWKEHVAWLVPIATTIVAYIASKYGPDLAKETRIRNAAGWFCMIAFAALAIASVLGASITKAAPVH